MKLHLRRDKIDVTVHGEDTDRYVLGRLRASIEFGIPAWPVSLFFRLRARWLR